MRLSSIFALAALIALPNAAVSPASAAPMSADAAKFGMAANQSGVAQHVQYGSPAGGRGTAMGGGRGGFSGYGGGGMKGGGPVLGGGQTRGNWARGGSGPRIAHGGGRPGRHWHGGGRGHHNHGHFRPRWYGAPYYYGYGGSYYPDTYYSDSYYIDDDYDDAVVYSESDDMGDAVARCASRYRSFDARTGTYNPGGGRPRQLCPYLR